MRDWVLVDPDLVEPTNLNRLAGATRWDAADRLPKVTLGRRRLREIHDHSARVRVHQSSLSSRPAISSLAGCDILIAATDNSSSRQTLQEISSAYVRPLVNAGVGLKADRGTVKGISFRVTSPPPGGPWCLCCGDVISATEVAKERSDPEHKAMFRSRGYLPGTPQPAVFWLNGLAANTAVSVVHSLVMPFRDQESPPFSDIFWDVMSLESLVVDHETQGDGCIVCSGMRGIGDAYVDSVRDVEIDPLPLAANPEVDAESRSLRKNGEAPGQSKGVGTVSRMP